jgi:PST family polysaccharide transporter
MAKPEGDNPQEEHAGDEYLDTEHLKDDLGERGVKGGVIQSIAQAGKSVVEIVSILALARLLTPEDFGLLGMVVSVTGFLAMFKDLGLSMATIQREELTHRQVSALFWINLGLSVTLMAIIAGLAPVLAWFYQEPRLLEITLVFAGTFLFSGLAVQHMAILKRQMRFEAVAGIEVTALIVSVSTAIGMAVYFNHADMSELGYWALVTKTILSNVLTAAGVWLLCGWRPGGPAWDEQIKELVTFGGNLTGHSVLNYLSANFDDILIGRYFGARPLGFFRKAHEILRIPLRQINSPIGSVAVPMMSRLVDDPEKYRRTYLRILEKTILLTMPLGVVMIATAEWIIFLVLGEQWLDAGPIFIALGIGLFYKPISNTTGWLFISQDRTHHMMRWGAMGSAMSITSFIVGLPWGPIGVAAAYSVSGAVIRAPILLWYVCREGPVRTLDIYKRCFPFAFGAGTVGVALYAFRRWSGIEHPVYGLLLALAITVVVYLVSLAILPSGRRALADVKTMVKMLRKEDAKTD